MLERQDGIRFESRPLRETYTVRSAGQFLRELRRKTSDLKYLHISEPADKRRRVAFGREPGYLLGEHIWEALGRPQNLIYCESLPQNETSLLVVVTEGHIRVDAEVPPSSIFEDIIPLLSDSDRQYIIKTHGDVPVAETEQPGKFMIEPQYVEEFSVLDEGLFETMPVHEKYKLRGLNEAVKAAKVRAFSPALVALPIVAVIAGWMVMDYYEEQQRLERERQQQQDPYEGYKKSLNTPAPAALFSRAVGAVEKLYSAPGWVPLEVTVTGSTMQAEMGRAGGTISALDAWGAAIGVDVTVNGNGVSLMTDLGVTSRGMASETSIRDASDRLAHLVDGFVAAGIGEGNVRPGNFVSYQVYRSQQINVAIKGWPLSDLRYLAPILSNRSVVLDSMTMKFDDDEAVDADLVITIYGS